MAIAELINEGKYGTVARTVNDLIEKLTTIDWYSKVGNFDLEAESKLDRFMEEMGVQKYEIKWITKEQVSQTIDKITFEGSQLWDVLKEVPEQLKKDVISQGNEQILHDVVDRVPEAIFHRAYSQAFKTFTDEKVIKFLVGHAMYISVLACTAEVASGKSYLSTIVELLEEGHLPLGPEGNTFYLL
ncbi:hypothetical protein [Bacillus sp. T3]|uniref:hypothetical protein n=1 Tax=Bacillus sp. T3 TaxID=467262 RepID=UPI0029813433|nr:hypothetical protein [Bacillus sp. T3]